MSLLPCTSHANPTTPFWATSGGGGGGGVTSIIAGAGISIDTPTGDVTITNTGGGGSSANVTIGTVDTGSNLVGINDGDTWTIGTFKQTTFYPTEDNYYIAGVTLNISQIISTNSSYNGNLWLTMEYTDGVTTSLQGRETITINHQLDNYYSASMVIGFKHIPGGVLNLSLTNREGSKINSLDYAITSFYCVDMGTTGSTGNALF